jgi:hypothetical protein
MTDNINIGALIARREYLKQTLANLPKIRKEIVALNELIALHDPLREHDDPKENSTEDHEPFVPGQGYDKYAWARSETNRLTEEAKPCEFCSLWFFPGSSMTMHRRLSHKGQK